MVKVEELCNIEKQSLKSCVVGVGSVLEKKKKICETNYYHLGKFAVNYWKEVVGCWMSLSFSL